MTLVWNDSLLGDYLWTSGNVGEAVPNVMTPATWSLIRVMAPPPVGPHPVSGNIGGRFYLNLSASLAMASAVGLGDRVRRANELTFGRLPDGVEIPPLPMSRAEILRATAGVAAPLLRDGLALRRRLHTLAQRNVEHCRTLRRRITAARDAGELHRLWLSDVRPLLYEVSPVFDAGARSIGGDRLESELSRLVGEEDARALRSGMHRAGGELASLGPLLGIARVRDGSMTAAAYADEWGHRGPDEFEVATPRPAEDPAWLDRQAAEADDPAPLLAAAASAREAAWRRLVSAHPKVATQWERRLEKAGEKGRAREWARSEFVRTFWVFREFYVRAGDLNGLGDDVFLLPVEELAAVLTGAPVPHTDLAERRAAYERYRALPPLPTVIRGRIDPEAWAADPHRRSDFYDATANGRAAAGEQGITGFPGSAGVVDGIARVALSIEDARALEPGEILVTTVTNVGWTPLFPRAAAVVTDVGAPLSHAAIVARELGIPAVVGCGDATSRIGTGDRVRVHGSAGTVTILETSRRAAERLR